MVSFGKQGDQIQLVDLAHPDYVDSDPVTESGAIPAWYQFTTASTAAGKSTSINGQKIPGAAASPSLMLGDGKLMTLSVTSSGLSCQYILDKGLVTYISKEPLCWQLPAKADSGSGTKESPFHFGLGGDL